MVERFCNFRRIPPDLLPRYLEDRELAVVPRSEYPYPNVGNAIYIGRSFQGRSVIVGTEPTPIIQSQVTWSYLILNPSRYLRITDYGLIWSGTETGQGDSTSNYIDAANYMDIHLFLDVTDITGMWQFIQKAYDSTSGKWFDVQVIFPNISVAKPYYSMAGHFGLAERFAVEWIPDGPDRTITFTLSYILKDGTIGSPTGVANTVFIGGRDVTTEFGFPILEGQYYTFVVEEGVELWGIAFTNVSLRVFQL